MLTMLNPPNSISLLRAFLAFLFIVESTTVRITVVILAMLTDCIDGYLARRYCYTSRIGAVLDPVMDKFFVYVVLAVLLYENQVTYWQAIIMLSRDFFLVLFILYLLVTRMWKNMGFKSMFWGKVSTAFQFIILVMVTLQISFPFFLYYAFILFGILTFVEMIQFSKKCLS